MNRGGFTLVELLAVIVILAIILAIAIPGITGIVRNASKSSFESDAKLLLKAIDYEKLKDDSFNATSIDKTAVSNILKLSTENYESINVTIENNIPFITIVGQNKWDGFIACGTYRNMKVTESIEDCIEDIIQPVITILGDNPANISIGGTYSDAGATATDNRDGDITDDIVVSGTVNPNIPGAYTITYTVSDAKGNETTASRTVNVTTTDYVVSEGVNRPRLATGMTAIKWNGSSWVTVASPDTDTTWYDYASKQWANATTADGSYWVWIPRYAYQVATNYHTNTAGTINVKFLIDNTNSTIDGTSIATTPTYSGASQTNYIKHPAFTFGSTELTGMWVAKFEMSGTTTALDSKPGVASLTNTTLGNMFNATRNMEIRNRYGWALASGLGTNGIFTTDTNNVDTHMMKNIEWGSIAYLGHSTFGKNAEITINNSSSYYTGGGTGTAYTTNVGQSTTGNVYGLYDISGGAYEYVVGNFGDQPGSSGLTPSTINNKYIDRYTVLDNTKYGDAMYETSSTGAGTNSWYADYSGMINASDPWFIRGGYYADTTKAGAFSYIYNDDGMAYSYISWRAVLLVGQGL